MKASSKPTRRNIWQSGWFWGVLGTILVTTAPPLIWYWFGIDREGRPLAPPPVATNQEASPGEPAPGELLQAGSVWSGTMLVAGKERRLYEMRLIVKRRDGDAFQGESHILNGMVVFEIEGKVEQSAISWKNVKVIQGKPPAGEQTPTELTGTILKETIEARRPLPGPGRFIEMKLRLDKTA